MEQGQNYVDDLERLFHASKDVLITTRAQPRIDSLCAILALKKAFGMMPLTTLSAPGQSRNTVVSVSGRQGTQLTLLPGSEHIVSELGLRDFVIGLPGYVDKSVESVSWYVNQGRLNVVLKSNPAVPMQFDPKLFDPFYAGANYDVVCVVDADSPSELGGLYRQDPGMFTELPVVNISTSVSNTRFGRINVVEQHVSSTSELLYELLSALRVNVDHEIASLLLCGIEDGSEMMQKATTRTNEIVQELSKLAGSPIDIIAVRGQMQNPPLPVFAQGVAPLHGQAPGYSGYGAPVYPSMPYSQPQQGYLQYPGVPTQPYGAYTLGSYPGYQPVQYPQQPLMGQAQSYGVPPVGQQSQPINQQPNFPLYHAPASQNIEGYAQSVNQQGGYSQPQQGQVGHGYGQRPGRDYGKSEGSGSA